MAFLSDKDVVELHNFAKHTKPSDDLIQRVREYVELMVVVSSNRPHPTIKELDARLAEINKLAQKNRPPGTKIPLGYLLMIQHLPVMRRYIEIMKTSDAVHGA